MANLYRLHTDDGEHVGDFTADAIVRVLLCRTEFSGTIVNSGVTYRVEEITNE